MPLYLSKFQFSHILYILRLSCKFFYLSDQQHSCSYSSMVKMNRLYPLLLSTNAAACMETKRRKAARVSKLWYYLRLFILFYAAIKIRAPFCLPVI